MQPRLLPLVAAYVGGLVSHLRCRPADVASVTHSELAIIFFGIAGALVSLGAAGAGAGAGRRWRRRRWWRSSCGWPCSPPETPAA